MKYLFMNLINKIFKLKTIFKFQRKNKELPPQNNFEHHGDWDQYNDNVSF